MSKQTPLIAGLAFGFALLGGAARAYDDEDHHHGYGLHHFSHDSGTSHYNGYDRDAHRFNHYLHDNGIPHAHVYPRRCYLAESHDHHGRHYYRRVCE